MSLNLGDDGLGVAVQNLLDIETTRIRTKNRLAALTRPLNQKDSDGIARGHGLSEFHPSVDFIRHIHEQLVVLEKECVKTIEGQFKTENPLAPFVERTLGLGPKSIVRLLGSIGDPYLHPPVYETKRDPITKVVISREVVTEGGFRTFGQLRQYCGLTPQSRKRVGQKVNFCPEARKRLYVITVATVKQRNSPYRATYDHWKATYQERVATDGKPWTAGHVEAATLRKVGDRILNDLYREARRLHEDSAPA